MARKKRKRTQPSLPLIKGEVWEIGRRVLDVRVADLERRGERPEILLAVQAGASGGVVRGDPVSSEVPAAVLADFALQAMREPLLGQPRRPAVIRVGSRAEAELLAVALATTGVAVEISARCEELDAIQQHLGAMFAGLASDYRTRAAQADETLSEAGLREFFRTARKFYREEMWLTYDDDVVFDIALQSARGPARTLYGIMMGSMGEEFGLVLFHTLDDLERFYELSVEHLDELTDLPGDDEEEFDAAQYQHKAEMTAQFLLVPAISLTYTPQQDVPPPLVQEALQLKLPLAKKSAFPLVMRTGQGDMQVAAATDLADMLSALRAILDWDKQLETMDIEDEIDVTVTSKLPAVEGLLPALTVQTTLRDNPCAPEEREELSSEEFGALFDALFTEPPGRKPAKQSGKSSGKKGQATGKKAAPKAVKSNRVYTLAVYLVDGPISEEYADQEEISRHIEIRGNQTLHDLHRAIFQAFDRWEHHLYEFNLGAGPSDRSQIYFYSGGWDADDEEAGDPETARLDDLDLDVGRRFGYLFDMGDSWEHVIEAVAVKEGAGKGKYPRVVEKVGAAPPQYPDNDEDEDF